MIFSLALRNVMAAKKRSFITFFLVLLSTFFFVIYVAFMNGSHQQMLRDAVEIYPGYIEITAKEYRDSPGNENLIFDVEEVIEKTKHFPEIEALSVRLESFMLFATQKASIGGLVGLITPKSEAEISRLKAALVEGAYPKASDEAQLYIGNEFAKRLGVTLGDEVSLIGSATDNSFAADNVKIGGIFRTGIFSFDSSCAFINKAYFDLVVEGENVASHIVITPKDKDDIPKLVAKINSVIDDSLIAEGWQTYLEDLVKGMEIDSIFGYLSISILFIVIFFVIMIYSLLSIFSRIREIGVMRAIGTTRREISLILGMEMFIIASIAVLIGALLGAIGSYYWYINPISLEGLEDIYKDYDILVVSIPTDFDLFTICWNALLMLGLSMLSTLYPIWKMNRFSPTQAMHHV
jgi:ABC-type lipoprotein release transport system permease subunit